MFLSMKQTCELLGRSRWTVTKLINAGELSATKGNAPNSHLRISRASIDSYIARTTIGRSAA